LGDWVKFLWRSETGARKEQVKRGREQNSSHMEKRQRSCHKGFELMNMENWSPGGRQDTDRQGKNACTKCSRDRSIFGGAGFQNKSLKTVNTILFHLLFTKG
jgi:hypothetical protein